MINKLNDKKKVLGAIGIGLFIFTSFLIVI